MQHFNRRGNVIAFQAGKILCGDLMLFFAFGNFNIVLTCYIDTHIHICVHTHTHTHNHPTHTQTNTHTHTHSHTHTHTHTHAHSHRLKFCDFLERLQN